MVPTAEPSCTGQPGAAGVASQACLPAGTPACLRADRIAESWAYGSFDTPLPPAVLASAACIDADDALRRLAGQAVWHLFEGPRGQVSGPLPNLPDRPGVDEGLFWLVVSLAFIPAVRAYHATLNLPEEITRDTCRQIACFALNHRRGHRGRWGIYRSQVGWLANYLAPNLYFRIGRFEYWRRPARIDYRAYRHHATGQVVALAADGIRFNAAGERCFRADDATPAGSWTARFTEAPDGVTGHPITPRGVAEPHTVHLPPAAWTCVLKPGDTVLDMHIPAGGNMPIEACTHSFQAAVELFRTRFPADVPRAIVCASWMFSNQLEACLPGDANLVRLLRELYLVPHPCAPNDGLWFVFLQNAFDPATAPRETSLQRAMFDYLIAGHHWQTGGMFLLCDDLSRVGTQIYRKR